MPRIPKYRRHSTRPHLACVELNRRKRMLGAFDSPESWQLYHRLIAEYLKPKPVAPVIPTSHLRVIDLITAFYASVKKRYVKNGQQTSEVHLYRIALRPVLKMFGELPADDFTPAMLETARQVLVDAGMARKKINQHTSRIRRMFKWGVPRGLVDRSTWHSLTTLEWLKYGEAFEPPKVLQVPLSTVEATKARMMPTVAAMVEFQLLTGCRPGEACIVRICDLSMSGPVWEYRPHTSKGQHHEIERVIYLGPRAQALLRSWFTTDLTAYLWSPAAGRRAYFESVTKAASKRSRHRQFKHKRAPGLCYTTGTYGGSVAAACKKAFPPPAELTGDEIKQWHKSHRWSPNQLRHTAASRIRSEFGIEMARIILGHRSAVTSEIYAEIDREKAGRIVQKLG